MREIRRRLGWSRYRAAKSIAISQSAWDYGERYANSVSVPTLIELFKLARSELGMEIAEFWALIEDD